MFLFDWFFSLFYAIMDILIVSKSKIGQKMNIYIKSNTGSTISVDIDPKMDIGEVKEMVAPQLGLQPEDVTLILAGKELEDSTIIQDCDLGEQSILHAVKTLPRRIRRTSQRLSKTEEISDLDVSADLDLIEVQTTNKTHFFVYCSTCRGLKGGKLRVRCADCKFGGFTVDNDPQSWQHVLQPNQITGDCGSDVCNGLYAQFYFRCVGHISEGEQDQAVPLHLIRTNVNEVPCLACTETSDPVIVFPCQSGHVTCLDCFRTYCSSRLNERQFISHPSLGYTLCCPAGCPQSFITEPHHFRLLDNTNYDRYQRYATEECVLQAGGVLCPQPDCGAAILADPDCDRVQCLLGCQYVFCGKCRQGYHLGDCAERSIDVAVPSNANCADYPVDQTKANKARWDEASSITIKVITKPCPQCRTHTERAGGCMHMVCTRANCGYHWCWVCQGPWQRECMGNHWFG